MAAVGAAAVVIVGRATLLQGAFLNLPELRVLPPLCAPGTPCDTSVPARTTWNKPPGVCKFFEDSTFSFPWVYSQVPSAVFGRA